MNEKTPFEVALRRLQDHLVSRIVQFATNAGSKVRGHLRNIAAAFLSGFAITFQFWLHIALPYGAVASVGWPLFVHGSIFTWWGYVGAILVAGPPVALSVPLVFRHLRRPTGRSLVPVTSNGPFIDVLRQVPNVPPTPSGYGFWLLYLVAPSILLTVATEVGWLAGHQYFVEVHNSPFAWFNVAPLDSALSGLKQACTYVGVCKNL